MLLKPNTIPPNPKVESRMDRISILGFEISATFLMNVNPNPNVNNNKGKLIQKINSQPK
ncbi:hypothetical protein D3C71_1891930 [compost metagenome]